MALIIKNGTVVTEEGVVQADILVEGERIAAVGRGLTAAGAEVIDASGMVVLPGVIDAHTHYSLLTRGALTIDDFTSGSLAAACGGVTTFIDYADPIEGKPLAEGLRARRAEAAGKACIDYHFHMCLYGERPWSQAELENLRQEGISSLKVFTTYEASRIPYHHLENLLVDAHAQGLLVTVHAEDDDHVRAVGEKLKEQGLTAPAYHGKSRPGAAEVKAVADVIALAEKRGVPVYIVHVSTGEGAAVIAAARARGVKVYGETCPHYLVLDDSCFQRDFPQQYIMTPPLRTGRDNEMLWQALAGESLQVVATDHCAYTLKQKEADTCFTTLPGIPGSETLLPLVFSEGYQKGRLTLAQLAAYLSTNPAKLFGLYPQKGVIRAGSDADVVLVDPNRDQLLTGEHLHSKAGYTPFHGLKVKGYPVMTISRGRVVYQNGRFVGEPGWGKFIKAGEIAWP
ncbi:MAG TPA: dihydropyrimidinase [Clostridia bacterium]|nr:dihydropyrimidinase [Clostridia bacterium]